MSVCTLVTQEAPDFIADAVMPDNTFGQIQLSSFRGKYTVLFFYPLDFTFVCPTELIAFSKRIKEFEERDVQVIGCSIDSQFTHNAWRNTAIKDGGIGPVKYTLAADVKHEICKAYDVEAEGGVAYRGAFLIDKMRDMEQSGRIDMGAFSGEPNMDDNEDKYGEDNKLDDLRSDGT